MSFAASHHEVPFRMTVRGRKGRYLFGMPFYCLYNVVNFCAVVIGKRPVKGWSAGKDTCRFGNIRPRGTVKRSLQRAD